MLSALLVKIREDPRGFLEQNVRELGEMQALLDPRINGWASEDTVRLEPQGGEVGRRDTAPQRKLSDFFKRRAPEEPAGEPPAEVATPLEVVREVIERAGAAGAASVEIQASGVRVCIEYPVAPNSESFWHSNPQSPRNRAIIDKDFQIHSNTSTFHKFDQRSSS